MADKTKLLEARISLVVSAVIAVLCFGALFRVELLLREHRALIAEIQEKTTCMESCQGRKDNKEVEDHVPESKTRERRHVTGVNPKNSSPPDVLKELRLCISNLKRGPPGPPGLQGPMGPSGVPGVPGLQGRDGQNCQSSAINYPPQVHLPLGPIYVAEKSSFILPACHVTGYPKPNTKWSKLMSTLPKTHAFIGKKTKFSQAETEDSGTYICTASNRLGSSIGTIQVIVVALPKFTTTPPPKVKAYPGETVRLSCKASADLPIKIFWNRINKELPIGRSHVHSDGTLTIKAATKLDNGEYVCKAVSKGVASAKVVTNLFVGLFPVAVYPLNGRYLAKDVSNQSPEGDFSNVECSKVNRSPTGGSCKFQGAQNSYIEIPNQENAKLDLKGSMTLLAFVNAEQPGPLFNYKVDGWGLHWWIVRGNPLNLFVRVVKRNMGWTTSLSSAIPRGQWKYVGFNYDKSTGVARLWIDGKEATSLFIGSFKTATQFPIRIGARVGDGRFFRGEITCLQVYKKALNEEQIEKARKICKKNIFAL